MIFNKIWKAGDFLKAWKKGKLVLIEKPRREREERTSYRPICLLNAMGKMYKSVVNRRLAIEL